MRITNAAISYSTTIHQPVDALSDEERALWFSDKTDGLAITDANALVAFKEEISSPSDLLMMESGDIDSINSTISTSTTDSRNRPQPKYRLPHRTVMRLKQMIRVVNYLSVVRRNITWNSIRWTHVMRFTPEWSSLVELTERNPVEIPKFRANAGTARHMLNLIDYLRTTYGTVKCSLYYLVCDETLRDDTAPEDAPELLEGRHFAEPNTRLSDEIRARASRSTAAAQADNETLYQILVSSFAGSANMASLAEEFEKTRDGVGFWKKLTETQCTADTHRRAGEENITWLTTNTWPGPMHGHLTKHVEKHRRQFANYQQASEHCVLQEYSDRTRVGWLLKSITSKDTAIQIRLNAIRDDPAYLDNFEKAAIYLAKSEYEGRDKKGPKRVRIQESEVSGLGREERRNTPTKRPRGMSNAQFNKVLTLREGKGPSGVEYRWHDKTEYIKLPAAQKKDLNQWRATKGLTVTRRKKGGDGGAGDGGQDTATLKSVAVSRFEQLSASVASISRILTTLPGIREHVAAATTQAQQQATTAAIQALASQTQSPAGAIGSVVLAPPTAGEEAAALALAQISAVQVDPAPTAEAEADVQASIANDVAAAASVGAQGILKKSPASSALETFKSMVGTRSGASD